jgi:hypothetical protein
MGWVAQVCSGPAGAVVGLFCVNPDGGDYGVWTAEAQQLVGKWAPAFGQAGCGLSLQRTRYYPDVFLRVPSHALAASYAHECSCCNLPSERDFFLRAHPETLYGCLCLG